MECWSSHDIDDNSYLEALIDTIYTYYPVDTNRVYQTGHSMGGYMANHLNCTSNRFTAFGSSGGGMHEVYGRAMNYMRLAQIMIMIYYPIIFTHGIQDQLYLMNGLCLRFTIG